MCIFKGLKKKKHRVLASTLENALLSCLPRWSWAAQQGCRKAVATPPPCHQLEQPGQVCGAEVSLVCCWESRSLAGQGEPTLGFVFGCLCKTSAHLNAVRGAPDSCWLSQRQLCSGSLLITEPEAVGHLQSSIHPPCVAQPGACGWVCPRKDPEHLFSRL